MLPLIVLSTTKTCDRPSELQLPLWILIWGWLLSIIRLWFPVTIKVILARPRIDVLPHCTLQLLCIILHLYRIQVIPCAVLFLAVVLVLRLSDLHSAHWCSNSRLTFTLVIFDICCGGYLVSLRHLLHFKGVRLVFIIDFVKSIVVITGCILLYCLLCALHQWALAVLRHDIWSLLDVAAYGWTWHFKYKFWLF